MPRSHLAAIPKPAFSLDSSSGFRQSGGQPSTFQAGLSPIRLPNGAIPESNTIPIAGAMTNKYSLVIGGIVLSHFVEKEYRRYYFLGFSNYTIYNLA